jgi:hypothetical protein
MERDYHHLGFYADKVVLRIPPVLEDKENIPTAFASNMNALI